MSNSAQRSRSSTNLTDHEQLLLLTQRFNIFQKLTQKGFTSVISAQNKANEKLDKISELLTSNKNERLDESKEFYNQISKKVDWKHFVTSVVVGISIVTTLIMSAFSYTRDIEAELNKHKEHITNIKKQALPQNIVKYKIKRPMTSKN